MHKVRNRMRAEAVKWEKSITRKGRKCTKLVIGCVRKRKIGEFYYEKREKVHKARNRIHRYNKNKDSLPMYLRSESLFFVC